MQTTNLIPLLNNTKWNEIFKIMAAFEIGFIVKLLNEDEKPSIAISKT